MADRCRGSIHGEGFAPNPCGLAAPFSILRESVNTAIQIKSHWTHLPETGGNLALRSAQAGQRDLMTTSAARLAGIEAPDEPLPVFRLLRTVVDNPIKAWPRALYRERLYRSRVVGRDTVYVMSPDLIRAVLLDDAER